MCGRHARPTFKKNLLLLPSIPFVVRQERKLILSQKKDVSNLLQRLCSLNPDAAISLHKKGRGTAQRCSQEELISKSCISDIIINVLNNNDLINNMSSLPPLALDFCCLSVLNSLTVADPIQLCYESRIIFGLKI